jgi:hypothetical protein
VQTNGINGMRCKPHHRLLENSRYKLNQSETDSNRFLPLLRVTWMEYLSSSDDYNGRRISSITVRFSLQ